MPIKHTLALHNEGLNKYKNIVPVNTGEYIDNQALSSECDCVLLSHLFPGEWLKMRS